VHGSTIAGRASTNGNGPSRPSHVANGYYEWANTSARIPLELSENANNRKTAAPRVNLGSISSKPPPAARLLGLGASSRRASLERSRRKRPCAGARLFVAT
jgi:hypothetical protein